MKQTLDFLKNHTALILAIVSGYLYLCTYFFESGYLQTFDISNDYLSIDLNTILSDSSKIIQLVLFTTFAYQVVKLPIRTWMKRTYINDFLGSLVCRFAAIILLARFASTIPIGWLKIIFFIWLAVVMIIIFIVVLKTYFKKNEALDIDNQIEKKVIKGNNFFQYDQYFWIIVIIIFPIMICSFLGEGVAAKTTHFSMINDSTKYLVIRKYGDQLICKDYNYTDKKLGKQIVIVKIPINKPIVLINYEVGNFYDERFSDDPTVPNKPKLKSTPFKKLNFDTLNNQKLNR